MSRFQELIVYCLAALVICGTDGFEIGPRYLMNDPCGGRCQQGHCSQAGNGYFHCVCNNGWAGTNCATLEWTLHQTTAPVNSGSHNLVAYCNHHGTWNGYSCVCLDNWSGDRCQFATIATTLDHCYNDCVHGHCVMGYDRYYHCRCDNSWHGRHCTEQSSDPCFATCVHGRCVPWHDGLNTLYYCHCDDSWQGDNCDTGTILPCGDTYCMHGECVSIIGPHGPENSHCECYHGWQGQTCESQSSSHTTVAPAQLLEMSPTSTTQIPTTSPSTVLMTSPTTEPSTVTTTTQTLPPVTATSPHHSSSTMVTVTSAMTTQVPCNKLSTLIDISQQSQADNQNASECSSGSHTSHEAFVLKNCPASQNPAYWQPGVAVITMCSSGVASVPDYTAIAAFENGRYAAIGGLSGILVGCLDDGFKMAVQRCDQPPHIVDIQVGGANLENPKAYFAIV